MASSSRKKVALRFVVPPELEQGVYATVAQVRGSAYDYTITFYRTVLPVSSAPPSTVEAQAVARVTIPRGIMDSFISALQENRRQISEAEAAKTSED